MRQHAEWQRKISPSDCNQISGIFTQGEGVQPWSSRQSYCTIVRYDSNHETLLRMLLTDDYKNRRFTWTVKEHTHTSVNFKLSNMLCPRLNFSKYLMNIYFLQNPQETWIPWLRSAQQAICDGTTLRMPGSSDSSLKKSSFGLRRSGAPFRCKPRCSLYWQMLQKMTISQMRCVSLREGQFPKTRSLAPPPWLNWNEWTTWCTPEQSDLSLKIIIWDLMHIVRQHFSEVFWLSDLSGTNKIWRGRQWPEYWSKGPRRRHPLLLESNILFTKQARAFQQGTRLISRWWLVSEKPSCETFISTLVPGVLPRDPTQATVFWIRSGQAFSFPFTLYFCVVESQQWLYQLGSFEYTCTASFALGLILSVDQEETKRFFL